MVPGNGSRVTKAGVGAALRAGRIVDAPSLKGLTFVSECEREVDQRVGGEAFTNASGRRRI